MVVGLEVEVVVAVVLVVVVVVSSCSASSSSSNFKSISMQRYSWIDEGICLQESL